MPRIGRRGVPCSDGRYGVADNHRRVSGAELPNGAMRPHAIGRRDFLRYSGMGAVAVGGATALAACASSSTPSSTSSTPATAGKPRKGGTLHAGLTRGAGGATGGPPPGGHNPDLPPPLALVHTPLCRAPPNPHKLAAGPAAP